MAQSKRFDDMGLEEMRSELVQRSAILQGYLRDDATLSTATTHEKLKDQLREAIDFWTQASYAYHSRFWSPSEQHNVAK